MDDDSDVGLLHVTPTTSALLFLLFLYFYSSVQYTRLGLASPSFPFHRRYTFFHTLVHFPSLWFRVSHPFRSNAGIVLHQGSDRGAS